MSSPNEPFEPFIGALLRYPHQAAQRYIIDRVNRAGFADIRLPYFAVFAYPGPEGARPSVLADRAGMTKQALNQLLKSLESLGYLERRDGNSGARSRVIRLTERGRELAACIRQAAGEVEDEWRRELGAARFRQLKGLLQQVWNSPLAGVRRDAPLDGRRGKTGAPSGVSSTSPTIR